MTKVIWQSYFRAFFKSIFLMLAVWVASWLINVYYPLSQNYINLIGVLGLGCGAIAVYGFVGWEVQTWDGNTPHEKLNQKLAVSFLSMGFICEALAYLLKPF